MLMPSVYVLRFIWLSHLTVLLLWAGNGNGDHDYECPASFDCGNLGMISFPFTKVESQECGALAILGCDDPNPNAVKRVQLKNGGRLFQVTQINNQRHWHTVSIIDEDLNRLLESHSCKAFSYNISLPPSSPLGYFYINNNITLFQCNRTLKVIPPKFFFKNTSCPGYDILFGPPNSDDVSLHNLAACSEVQLPMNGLLISANTFAFLTAEIPIRFRSSDECFQCRHDRGGPSGHCRIDSKGKFYCSKVVDRSNWFRKIGFGVVLAVTVLTLLLLMGWLIYTRWKEQNPTHLLIEAFLERHGPLQTRRYTYSEIKKVTNSFRNKLGHGGFGSVYKGQLQNGSDVAVKVLREFTDNGEEFINEVASISRTSHVNIVTLLGFCFEGTKRALVYEFMPNGSLEKFIFEENALMVDRQLDCQTLYHIAIGVARGLEYLHKGCNTRIVHFDIKPHNILLDENFCPKISDFGLAKVCMRKESIVSIFGARGTVGYIAPEVFSRNFGAVSHKSDVYSYGMMVLDMVGTRKNVNVEVDCSSDIYFPHWIYNRLQSNQELGLRSIRNESDKEKVRNMTIVSLWCIQTNPSTRPAISEVVEMLEERVELLQMPPKPFLFSPSTSMVHCSTGTCETL